MFTVHDTEVTFALSEFTPVPFHGSIFVYMILPQNVMPACITLVWVHPGCCTRATISLQYEISQWYHVNAKRAHVSLWNRSASRLECVVHAWCLQFWITHVFYQHEMYLQITRYEMTQSSCKCNTKSKSHPSMKLALVRVSRVNAPLHPVLGRFLLLWMSGITKWHSTKEWKDTD